MTKTSVFKKWTWRFKEPCGCGYTDEMEGEEIYKYMKPVLYLDSEIITQATVAFIYCPACGTIEEVEPILKK